MKRYEKMSKEEIIGIFIEKEQILRNSGIAKYLGEEVTPRVAKINTAEELETAYQDYKEYCGSMGCGKCKYYGPTPTCFVNFLEEGI